MSMPMHKQAGRGGRYQPRGGRRGGALPDYGAAPPGPGRGRGRGQQSSSPAAYEYRSLAGNSAEFAPSDGPVMPDLHQANQLVCSSDSTQQPPAVQHDNDANKMTLVSLSMKDVQFPLRPGFGRSGRRCIIKANHFLAQLLQNHIYQYDVSITPEVTSPVVSRSLIQQLVELYRQSYLGNRLPAYDGRKILYAAGPLPFTSKTFEITLVEEKDGSCASTQRRERLFKVAIKFAATIHPQDAFQALDIVLRQLPTSKYTPIGRSFYGPNLGRRVSLGDGLESWRGFYQSMRPTQMGFSLNIDMSSTAFIEPLPVVEFVAQLLNRGMPVKSLNDADRVKIKKALIGVKVEVTHRGNMRRKYRISGLTSASTGDLTFPDEHGMPKSVVDYFQEMYSFKIQLKTWPCLQVGNIQRPIYLPMEVCKIVEGQRYSKRLNEKQITALLKATCQRPSEREDNILKTVRQNNYSNDPYAQEFGIKISDRLASVEARVLPPPLLKYHDTGKEIECRPWFGQWNMKDKKMVNGGRVTSWCCINFDINLRESIPLGFCEELAQMCNKSGMDFSPRPLLPVITQRPDQVERALRTCYNSAMDILRKQKKEFDLLIVILPDNNGPLYGNLKRICETDLGIVSQCCLAKHVRKTNNFQYLANVALKINVKVGGRNAKLVDESSSMPLVGDKHTIIFGADVTHPHPGEDSSASIAAVVASQDWPEVTKYAARVSAQSHREEIIQDLHKTWQDPQGVTVGGGMIKDLLDSFRKTTGEYPRRIIFYRDGVSEGQFYQVLLYELSAIREACRSIRHNYEPTVTFVVVQKRHHTRFFAENHADKNSVDRSGNILPGTVVDSKICHPTQFDFYLCSHAGIQGTSRPVHYHVLWDENNFTADQLEILTNNLCYSYARCTRSVSIVPPVYYAHLAAFRARFYVKAENTGPRMSRTPGNLDVKPLPALKDKIKSVMFYC